MGLLLGLGACSRPKNTSEAFLDDYESHHFLPNSDPGGASLIEFLRSPAAPQAQALKDFAEALAFRAADSSGRSNVRENYFITLKTEKLEALLEGASLDALTKDFQDANEDLYFRLLAASVLSKSSRSEDPSLEAAMVSEAEAAVQQNQYPATAVKMVLGNYYLQDANVRGFVSSLLDMNARDEGTKVAKDSALVLIEKFQDQSQIPHLESLLQDGVLRGSFTRARALNALAGVGGEEVLPFLLHLPLDADYQNRADLLLALGISRAKDAGKFLTDDLERYGENGEFAIVLEALQYLGDPKTLGPLQAYAAKHSLNPERQRLMSEALETIQKGGKAAPGMDSEWSGE